MNKLNNFPEMKEITLKIPDQRIDFFMDLVNQLGFEVSEEIEIPEEHKNIVRERKKNQRATPKDLLIGVKQKTSSHLINAFRCKD